MLEKLFYFGLGYIVARYLILHNGVDAYTAKENQLIGAGKQKINDIKDEYLLETEVVQEEYAGFTYH